MDTQALPSPTWAGGAWLGVPWEKLDCSGDRDLGEWVSIPKAEMLRQRVEGWAGYREVTHWGCRGTQNVQ